MLREAVATHYPVLREAVATHYPKFKVFVLPATVIPNTRCLLQSVTAVSNLLIFCQGNLHFLKICSHFALNKFRTRPDVFYMPPSVKKIERYPVKICIAFETNLQAIVSLLLGS